MDREGLPGQRCSATDPEENKTSVTYDSKGNLVKVDRPSAQEDISYTYDALGRTDTVTDGRGGQDRLHVRQARPHQDADQ
ncbi:hypothetical protein ACIQRZ_17220 [Streptomyces rubiginosohelvolus]|uniref:hypothetical protein n=1 Tax=Streptomyces rubiginosohelvolus TaxID=67362 RepID=UPI003800B1F4